MTTQANGRERETYDAIVIGSGIGGLAAAGALARAAGKRVLVLEKHTEPGGQTHVFRRDGASWDVGVHYLGQTGPGEATRTYLDFLTGGELDWNRMPESYDRFVYPDVDFRVPAGRAEYQQALIDAYPDEAKAIRRYFRDILRCATWTVVHIARGMLPTPLVPLVAGLNRATGRAATGTTEAYLDKHFRSPQLRALLASQWGDYGLPPSKSAFAIHALIVAHYLGGAWFPAGGSARIARTIERAIEQAGGAVRVGQEVTGILVEDGRAVGVSVLDRRGPADRHREYRAPVVISDVGARLTHEKLLPDSGTVAAATEPARRALAGLGPGTSAVVAYLRLRDGVHTLGIEGENVWVFRYSDHEKGAAHAGDLITGNPAEVFVSFPSVKAGDETHHTAEIISFIDATAFEKWRGTPTGNRGEEYSQLKARMYAGMLGLAETAIPGLRDLVDYAEISTPLTVEHYTTHPDGAFYGLPATPQRFRMKPLGPRTAVPGLYLSGQDVGTLGIGGALMGGIAAASQVLGPGGFPKIRRAMRRAASGAVGDHDGPLPEGKLRATLAAKRRLTPVIWEAEFRLDGRIGEWSPGQFARLHVGDDAWRDYSIAHADGSFVRLLISTRTGGRGSRFIETAGPGTRTRIELPLGRYALVPSDRRTVFVATGTGLAPMLPMFSELDRAGRLADATLVFGCRTRADDLTLLLDGPLPGTVLRRYSRETPAGGAEPGRVTDALAGLDADVAGTDFYVCGSAAMVADCRRILESRGARHLFTEPY